MLRTKSKLKTRNNSDTLNMFDRSYGCVLGVLCGDAAGASLEFFNKPITREIASRAMTMPGGGKLKVGPGQYTDDSELTISLLYALYSKNPKKGYPINEIADQYKQWIESDPFDIGCTCANAFSVTTEDNDNVAGLMMHNALESINSEANGALMRVAPIGIWASSESDDVITGYAKLDALLSHPNIVCQECNAIYCLAIAHLIQNKTHADVMEKLDTYVENNVNSKTVKGWYDDSKQADCLENLDCTKHIGHVRWGFTMAMYFLRKKETYFSGILQTLMKGGDTDTNSAIVGGLIGALHGFQSIPDYIKEPVLNFMVSNPEPKGHMRPKKFDASNIRGLTQNLFTHDPVMYR